MTVDTLELLRRSKAFVELQLQRGAHQGYCENCDEQRDFSALTLGDPAANYGVGHGPTVGDLYRDLESAIFAAEVGGAR